jgi:5,6-dimethylbenzimidazole synthase
MTESAGRLVNDFKDRAKYDALMDVVKNRLPTRAFDSSYVMPSEHYEMILEAARHAPSGANSQPWHFIAVADQDLKNKIAEYFREEQVRRAKLKKKFSTPDCRGLASAPGVFVVVSDFRWVKAFPVLNDGSELDEMYKENAERILLQSVAAATMSAHLAAAALGYNVWWATAIGQEKAQQAMKPLLGIPKSYPYSISCVSVPRSGRPTNAGRKLSLISATGTSLMLPTSSRKLRSTSGWQPPVTR